MTRSDGAQQAVTISGLKKSYGPIRAVRNLDLQVLRGEIFGFLGLNGAGKTTTLRILLDLIRPDAGKAEVLGHDCQSGGLAVRALVGYLPDEMAYYGDMTGAECLRLLGRLSTRRANLSYRSQLQEQLELSSSDLRRKLREYSTGMKRKLGILQAFQNDPPLLILDEPTEGLDPLMQEAFYKILFEARQKGSTVFMSSHVLSEVERVCDRIGMIRDGELVLVSPVEEIRKMAARRVRVFFYEDVRSAPPALPPDHEFLEAVDRRWTFRIRGPLASLVQALAGLPVSDLQIEEPRLEDVLLKYYRREPE